MRLFEDSSVSGDQFRTARFRSWCGDGRHLQQWDDLFSAGVQRIGDVVRSRITEPLHSSLGVVVIAPAADQDFHVRDLLADALA